MQDIDSRLFVFSTQRLVLEFYTKHPQSLSKAITIGDFFKHLYFVPNKTLISPVLQKIILYNIISQMPSVTNLFVFEHSFLGHLESSDFLTHFFREIVTHNVDLHSIPLKDIYSDYVEHLQILESIFMRYKQKLDEYRFCAVPHQNEVQLIEPFITSFSAIEVHLDGLLNPFEVWILEQVAQIRPLIIHIRTDDYNKDHFKWLGITLEAHYEYKINMTSKTLITQESYTPDYDIKAFYFDLRLSQSAYILEQVRILLNSGVQAQDVAIILPDMAYRDFLQTLDLARNLNYAMGRSIVDFEWFENLKSLSKDPPPPNISYINAVSVFIENLKIAPPIIAQIQAILGQYEQVSSEIESLSWEDFIHLFVEEIALLNVDDVKGGKVCVMGILETRGLHFKYALIPDFNDGYVPRIKDNDMFLNTTIRQNLGMPTLKDRQDLQKHYYYQLFCNTQKTHLTYCLNDEESAASLIDECKINSNNGDEHFALFANKTMRSYKAEEISGEIDSDFVFSAASLKVFLECKRKFYYQYILKVSKPRETSPNLELGNAIHSALCGAFSKYLNIPLSEVQLEAIKEDFTTRLTAQNKTQEFFYLLACREMQGFWKEEKKRIQKGFKTIGCEEIYEGVIGGRRVKGRFDRVDEEAGTIVILDYKYQKKSQNNAKLSLLQLGLYKMILEQNSEYQDRKIQACVCFLRESENPLQIIAEEDFLVVQEEIQEAMIESRGKILFDLVDHRKKCSGCEFVGFCGRF